MSDEKHVDESWKDEVAKTKTEGDACGCGHDHAPGEEHGKDQGMPENNGGGIYLTNVA